MSNFWKSALTGLAGGLGPGLFSLGSSLLTNKGALSRQRLADQQNIKFWNMQNEYNTPAQQMARLKKAGLNPALIYGSGSAQTGVAGSIAPSKPAPYNIKNPVPLQAMLMEAQIGNLQEDTNKKKAEINKINELLGGQVTSVDLKNDLLEIKKEIAGKTKEHQMTIIKNSALSSGFNQEILSADRDAALGGFLKGNPVFTLFKQLGIAGEGKSWGPDGEWVSNSILRQGLIYGLLGSTIFKNLSSSMGAIIKNLTPKK